MKALILILLLSAVIACTASEFASTPTQEVTETPTPVPLEESCTKPTIVSGSNPKIGYSPYDSKRCERFRREKREPTLTVVAESKRTATVIAEKTVTAEMLSRIDASDPKNGVCVEGLTDLVFGEDLPGSTRPSTRAMGYAIGGKGEWPLNDEHWKWCRYTERDKCHLTDEDGVLVVRLYGLPNSDEKYGCPTDEDLKHKQSYCWTVDNKPVYNASCPKGHEEYWSPRGWTRN